MNFSERLNKVIDEQNSLLCVGLDPVVEKMPDSIKNEPDPLFKFCAEIIESTKQFAAAFKINFAFFELHGSRGWVQLEQLLGLIPDNCLTIADAKRADIGSSSEMYARAILTNLGFDAVTVNPYLGGDSVSPFIQWPEKGAFILGVTSNPGAKEFQHLKTSGQPLYSKVIQTVNDWNSKKNCGLVVGATHPQQMHEVRNLVPELPFLIPGVGAQGGSLEDAVLNGTNEQGGGVLINSSRGIIFKSNKADFGEAAQNEAARLAAEINHWREKKRS
jgi:orotidine-5'-phosphate decarboxylase